MVVEEKTMKKKNNSILIILIILVILVVLIYFITGLYIVPANPLSKGKPYWFVRTGTHFPFLSSPYSLMKSAGNINIAIGKAKQIVSFQEEKVMITFKYSEYLYDITKK